MYFLFSVGCWAGIDPHIISLVKIREYPRAKTYSVLIHYRLHEFCYKTLLNRPDNIALLTADQEMKSRNLPFYLSVHRNRHKLGLPRNQTLATHTFYISWLIDRRSIIRNTGPFVLSRNNRIKVIVYESRSLSLHRVSKG